MFFIRAAMNLLHRLWLYSEPHKVQLGFGILSILVANILKVSAPIVLQRAVDNLMVGVTGSLLLQEFLLLVAIALLQGVSLFMHDRLLEGASRDMERDLRNDFYRHLQRLPLEFFHANRTGDLLARATNDLKAAIT